MVTRDEFDALQARIAVQEETTAALSHILQGMTAAFKTQADVIQKLPRVLEQMGTVFTAMDQLRDEMELKFNKT